MNPILKLFGASVIGAAVAGCAPSLSTANKKLATYDTNGNFYMTSPEARLLILNEFDTSPKDGKISDEETLKVMGFLETLPDNPGTNHTNYTDARRIVADALISLRKEGKEKSEKNEAR